MVETLGQRTSEGQVLCLMCRDGSKLGSGSRGSNPRRLDEGNLGRRRRLGFAANDIIAESSHSPEAQTSLQDPLSVLLGWKSHGIMSKGRSGTKAWLSLQCLFLGWTISSVAFTKEPWRSLLVDVQVYSSVFRYI